MRRLALLLPLFLLAACEQARRYPPLPATPGREADAMPVKQGPLPGIWTWMPAGVAVHDVPIEFVPSTSPVWASLPTFWNADPLPGAGARTVFLGLPPLEAVAAYGMAEQLQRFRIKVPRGLPDPNPYIPAANPPSYAKWRLGRDLFFAPVLRSGSETYSCASCHQPDHGFAEPQQKARHGRFNTPGLINAVYNRRQFWDGRARDLEEVVVRSLEDERPTTGEQNRREITHRWGGLVQRLDADTPFRVAFQTAFGIEKPTQDAIARALATYLRTLLSGDSVYDRAEEQRQRAKTAALEREHFVAVLDAPSLAQLGAGKLEREALADRLVLGSRLFHGKAGCATCHRGPLFTDHDYHNLGLYTRHALNAPEPPPGRFATAPIGLKDERLIGAFRTRSLRGLPRTGPYFHAGQRYALRDVVVFYDREIWPTRSLAAALRQGDREQQLRLTDAEIDALVLFLTTLDGTPLDPVVAALPR